MDILAHRAEKACIGRISFTAHSIPEEAGKPSRPDAVEVGPWTTQSGSCPGAHSSSCCPWGCCNISWASEPSRSCSGCKTANGPGLGDAPAFQGYTGGQESVWPLLLWWLEGIPDTRLRSHKAHQSDQSSCRSKESHGAVAAGGRRLLGGLSEGQPGLGHLFEPLGLNILRWTVDWGGV